MTVDGQNIYDYRFDGYWRIGQVFHHRNANDIDVKGYADDTCFLRGHLMKLTFAPMWVQMERRQPLLANKTNCDPLDVVMQKRRAYWDAKANVRSHTTVSGSGASTGSTLSLSPFAIWYGQQLDGKVDGKIRTAFDMLNDYEMNELGQAIVLMKAMHTTWSIHDLQRQVNATARHLHKIPVRILQQRYNYVNSMLKTHRQLKGLYDQAMKKLHTLGVRTSTLQDNITLTTEAYTGTGGLENVTDSHIVSLPANQLQKVIIAIRDEFKSLPNAQSLTGTDQRYLDHPIQEFMDYCVSLTGNYTTWIVQADKHQNTPGRHLVMAAPLALTFSEAVEAVGASDPVAETANTPKESAPAAQAPDLQTALPTARASTPKADREPKKQASMGAAVNANADVDMLAGIPEENATDAPEGSNNAIKTSVMKIVKAAALKTARAPPPSSEPDAKKPKKDNNNKDNGKGKEAK